jgi:hypothetical protein
MNNFIISSLQTILATYNSMTAYFYQKIPQTKYTNNSLANFQINYTLLLPASQFQKEINLNQVNAQMQAYITLCNALIIYITTNVEFQTNLFYEQIQNQLNTSITQINGFAISLLEAATINIFNFTVPNDMGLTNAMQLNGLDMNTYPLQASLNYNLADFNNIIRDTTIILSKGTI